MRLMRVIVSQGDLIILIRRYGLHVDDSDSITVVLYVRFPGNFLCRAEHRPVRLVVAACQCARSEQVIGFRLCSVPYSQHKMTQFEWFCSHQDRPAGPFRFVLSKSPLGHIFMLVVRTVFARRFDYVADLFGQGSHYTHEYDEEG